MFYRKVVFQTNNSCISKVKKFRNLPFIHQTVNYYVFFEGLIPIIIDNNLIILKITNKNKLFPQNSTQFSNAKLFTINTKQSILLTSLPKNTSIYCSQCHVILITGCTANINIIHSFHTNYLVNSVSFQF